MKAFSQQLFHSAFTFGHTSVSGYHTDLKRWSQVWTLEVFTCQVTCTRTYAPGPGYSSSVCIPCALCLALCHLCWCCIGTQVPLLASAVSREPMNYAIIILLQSTEKRQVEQDAEGTFLRGRCFYCITVVYSIPGWIFLQQLSSHAATGKSLCFGLRYHTLG